MALVVPDAARIEFAVAQGRLKRRAVPEFQRLGGLHVVVVIEEERPLVGPRRLAIDDREAVARHHRRREAVFAQQSGSQLGALVNPQPLRRNARLPTEPRQLLQRLLKMCFQIRVHTRQIDRHPSPHHVIIGALQRAARQTAASTTLSTPTPQAPAPAASNPGRVTRVGRWCKRGQRGAPPPPAPSFYPCPCLERAQVEVDLPQRWGLPSTWVAG